MKKKRRVTEKKIKKKVAKKISHMRKPQELSLEKWQVLLRKQIATEQRFRMKNIGSHDIFSDFHVTNPVTGKTYRVAIGGEALGMNYCSCPDFAINTLGTCKHIESALNKLHRKKGGKKALREGTQWNYSVVTLRYGIKRRVAFLLGKEASAKLKELVAQFFDEDLFLTEQGFRLFDRFAKQVEALDDEVRYHQDALELVANVRDSELREKRIKEMFSKGIAGPQWKSLLKTNLYSYQREGVLFAASAGRCLIADEMGLGKTIQAIAASEVMAKSFGVEKVLIVCPTSLKYQWKREIEKFTTRSVQIVEGTLLKRHRQYEEKSFFKIVNYDVIHRDMAAISEWGPDLVILDEAQRIKNWQTRRAQSVKQLKSPYAIVLTGTPLENRLEELHSIVGFIDQHHLGPLFRFIDSHQKVNEEGKLVGYRNLHNLGTSLNSIMVRRRRDDVLKQLPGRIDKNYFVKMTTEQIDVHEENQAIVARLVAKWKRCHFLTEQERQRLMICLQNIRMVCDNTYLLDQSTMHGNKINELETQLEEIFENPDTKIVIFSQWLRMMELVSAMLNVNGWKYAFLNGGVPSAKRGELIKTFHEDPDCRVFLSTEAGGVGLNLQNANIVINMDMPWNPAVLEQRVGRVHRIGQKQPVRVINFISECGIEHGMLSLLKFKSSMFSGVLDKGDNEVFMGTSKFNKFMQTIEKASESTEAKVNVEAVQEEDISSREEITKKTEAGGQERKLSMDGLSSGRDTLKTILQMGASFLENLGRSVDNSKEDEEKKKSAECGTSVKPAGIRFQIDESTGQKTLQIPMPDEKSLKQLTQTLEGFLDVLRK